MAKELYASILLAEKFVPTPIKSYLLHSNDIIGTIVARHVALENIKINRL
jgi:hypothetical protein